MFSFVTIVFFYYSGLYLRRNTVLKELWLAHNDLTSCDASNIGTVLKSNLHLQFLDISNNSIEVGIDVQFSVNRHFSKYFLFKTKIGRRSALHYGSFD